MPEEQEVILDLSSGINNDNGFSNEMVIGKGVVRGFATLENVRPLQNGTLAMDSAYTEVVTANAPIPPTDISINGRYTFPNSLIQGAGTKWKPTNQWNLDSPLKGVITELSSFQTVSSVYTRKNDRLYYYSDGVGNQYPLNQAYAVAEFPVVTFNKAPHHTDSLPYPAVNPTNIVLGVDITIFTLVERLDKTSSSTLSTRVSDLTTLLPGSIISILFYDNSLNGRIAQYAYVLQQVITGSNGGISQIQFILQAGSQTTPHVNNCKCRIEVFYSQAAYLAHYQYKSSSYINSPDTAVRIQSTASLNGGGLRYGYNPSVTFSVATYFDTAPEHSRSRTGFHQDLNKVFIGCAPELIFYPAKPKNFFELEYVGTVNSLAQTPVLLNPRTNAFVSNNTFTCAYTASGTPSGLTVNRQFLLAKTDNIWNKSECESDIYAGITVNFTKVAGIIPVNTSAAYYHNQGLKDPSAQYVMAATVVYDNADESDIISYYKAIGINGTTGSPTMCLRADLQLDSALVSKRVSYIKIYAGKFPVLTQNVADQTAQSVTLAQTSPYLYPATVLSGFVDVEEDITLQGLSFVGVIIVDKDTQKYFDNGTLTNPAGNLVAGYTITSQPFNLQYDPDLSFAGYIQPVFIVNGSPFSVGSPVNVGSTGGTFITDVQNAIAAAAAVYTAANPGSSVGAVTVATGGTHVAGTSFDVSLGGTAISITISIASSTLRNNNTYAINFYSSYSLFFNTVTGNVNFVPPANGSNINADILAYAPSTGGSPVIYGGCSIQIFTPNTQVNFIWSAMAGTVGYAGTPQSYSADIFGLSTHTATNCFPMPSPAMRWISDTDSSQVTFTSWLIGSFFQLGLEGVGSPIVWHQVPNGAMVSATATAATSGLGTVVNPNGTLTENLARIPVGLDSRTYEYRWMSYTHDELIINQRFLCGITDEGQLNKFDTNFIPTTVTSSVPFKTIYAGNIANKFFGYFAKPTGGKTIALVKLGYNEFTSNVLVLVIKENDCYLTTPKFDSVINETNIGGAFILDCFLRSDVGTIVFGKGGIFILAGSGLYIAASGGQVSELDTPIKTELFNRIYQLTVVTPYDLLNGNVFNTSGNIDKFAAWIDKYRNELCVRLPALSGQLNDIYRFTFKEGENKDGKWMKDGLIGLFPVTFINDAGLYISMSNADVTGAGLDASTGLYGLNAVRLGVQNEVIIKPGQFRYTPTQAAGGSRINMVTDDIIAPDGFDMYLSSLKIEQSGGDTQGNFGTIQGNFILSVTDRKQDGADDIVYVSPITYPLTSQTIRLSRIMKKRRLRRFKISLLIDASQKLTLQRVALGLKIVSRPKNFNG